jgi:hypothetical protein
VESNIFGGVNIFSSPIFCRQRYYVVANILSLPVFFLRRYFVESDILLTSIFCGKRYFGGSGPVKLLAA